MADDDFVAAQWQRHQEAEFIGEDWRRVNPPAKHVTVLAIDPGTTQSAWLLLDCCDDNHDARMPWPVLGHGIVPNDEMRRVIVEERYDAFAIEWVQSFGMPVGAEVFETVAWIGVFEERCRATPRTGYAPIVAMRRYTRQQIKLHHCNSNKANDGTIRQALIDRFGGRIRAIGTKKIPGPLNGIANDVWSALAIATKFADDWKAPF
jgi:hypothetical protein